MSDQRTADVVLGILFFGVLAGLGYVTIALSDFAFGEPRFDVELLSPDVGYLRPGDPVLLHGMPAGKVTAIERLPEPVRVPQPAPEAGPLTCTILVRTRLQVDPWPLLGPDHAIHIEDRGLLGGKLIRIEAGTLTTPLDRDAPLVALLTRSAWQTASAILEENREPIQKALANLESYTTEANDGTGLLAMLARDASLAEDVRALAADLSATARSIRSGEGTLGRLVDDPTLYDDFGAVAASWREISANVQQGEGTVGRLFNDDDLYERWRSISTRLDEGEGTIGRLLNDETVYTRLDGALTDLAAASADLADLAERIDAGEGVLGALVGDDELADELRQIVDQALAAIEDARESAPVQEVGSLLFGTF